MVDDERGTGACGCAGGRGIDMMLHEARARPVAGVHVELDHGVVRITMCKLQIRVALSVLEIAIEHSQRR